MFFDGSSHEDLHFGCHRGDLPPPGSFMWTFVFSVPTKILRRRASFFFFFFSSLPLSHSKVISFLIVIGES